MSDPILTSQLRSKLPEVLHPIFMRLTQQAVTSQALRGMPVGEGGQEYLILQDEAAAAWIAATSAQLTRLLKTRVVPPELAPLIDGALLEAMLTKPARDPAPDKKKGGKTSAVKPGQDSSEAAQTGDVLTVAGAAREPAA